MAQLASRGGHCCPICSQSLLGPSAKYHIKVCARHTLAQLDSCASCGRLVRKDDLEEHRKRCKGKAQLAEDGLSEDLKKAWQERGKILRQTLAKIEAGEIGSLDPRGFFVCSICGQQGLGLVQILAHEEHCRERLSAEGHVPQPDSRDQIQALQLQLVDKLAALKTEIAEAAVVSGQDPGELLSLSLDRLRDVAKNACFREEKKYRRLRMSNAAVAEAIGRWKAAVAMLEAIGFELTMHTSKTGDAEPHLIMAMPLAEATFKVYLDVLDGKELDTGCSMLEECSHCKRKFRFDRIAKHETRCPESKAKPAKLDVVAKLLAGTPGEKHIPEVKRSLQNFVKLPPLIMKKRDDDHESDMLQECLRCKRRFSAEALERHAKRCTATPGSSSTRLSPLSSEKATSTPRSASRPSSSSARYKDANPSTSDSRDKENRRDKQIRGTRNNSEQIDGAVTRSGSRGSGSRDRVQRPLTPKRTVEAKESRRASDMTGSGPGYPKDGQRSQKGQQLVPSYEQLELDVADWLDEA